MVAAAITPWCVPMAKLTCASVIMSPVPCIHDRDRQTFTSYQARFQMAVSIFKREQH